VKAARQAVAEMFASGVGKLSFYPLAAGLAIASVLVNIGAKREGRMEEQTLVNGKPVDILIYGLTKRNFEEKNNALGSSASSTPRSGIVDSGLVPVGPAENDHANEPAGKSGDDDTKPVDATNVLTGVAGANDQPGELLPELGQQSNRGAIADQERGSAGD
jgi:hypothetical protein